MHLSTPTVNCSHLQIIPMLFHNCLWLMITELHEKNITFEIYLFIYLTTTTGIFFFIHAILLMLLESLEDYCEL